MTEPFVTVGLLSHPCYTFHQRMVNCFKQEEFASRMCFKEMEDWHECKGRKKHRAFQSFVNTEVRKMKIYSLPKYDVGTDSFSDGPLPKNADDYFAKNNDFQKYYS